MFKNTKGNTLRVALLITILFSLTGCEKPSGSGHMGSKNKTLSGFHSIQVCGQAEVNIIRSGKESVKITADDNLLDAIGAEVTSKELVLNCNKAQRDKSLKLTQIPKFDVEIVSIDTMIVDGESTIKTTEPKKAIEGNDFNLTVNGEANVNLQLAVTNFQSQISGNAKVVLKGKTETQQSLIMGAGLFHAEGLISKSCNISVSGDAKAYVSADNSLEILINGNGSVYYTGSPTLQQSVNGTGTIGKINISNLNEATTPAAAAPATPAGALPN